MLDRRTLGDIPKKHHSVFYINGQKGYEHVVSRDGFSGGFSLLYSSMDPTSLKEVNAYTGASEKFLGKIKTDTPNARIHVKPKPSASQDLIQARTALFLQHQGSRTSQISLAKSDKQHHAFCNGDFDELYFVKNGSGELFSMFGALKFLPGDYILIPRGISYTFSLHTEHLEGLCLEAHQIEIPPSFRNSLGQLKLEAPYTHRDFRSPSRLLSKDEADLFLNTVTLRNGQFTSHVYSQTPVFSSGWDGSVYPLSFSISDYLPKTGKVHLPPNLHLTFQAKEVVVCSFVPRLVDYGENAIPCPYPHSNVDCDELLYYVSGHFTSRAGISGGSFSFHPAGLPHGPQPGKYFDSVGTKETQEVAVMIDTWHPLHLTSQAQAWEEQDYRTSWNLK